MRARPRPARGGATRSTVPTTIFEKDHDMTFTPIFDQLLAEAREAGPFPFLTDED